jgi:hypothetical protein
MRFSSRRGRRIQMRLLDEGREDEDGRDGKRKGGGRGADAEPAAVELEGLLGGGGVDEVEGRVGGVRVELCVDGCGAHAVIEFSDT